MAQREYIRLYGGILGEIREDGHPVAVEAHDQPTPVGASEKPLSSPPPGEVDAKRRNKRGRPRVDPRDQNAVEVAQVFPVSPKSGR
jgi:hypothetical protein